ncbi:hypothetical protein M9458_054695, partial [Cirrhinus mrigala]
RVVVPLEQRGSGNPGLSGSSASGRGTFTRTHTSSALSGGVTHTLSDAGTHTGHGLTSVQTSVSTVQQPRH